MGATQQGKKAVLGTLASVPDTESRMIAHKVIRRKSMSCHLCDEFFGSKTACASRDDTHVERATYT